jgi:hypothetical protein
MEDEVLPLEVEVVLPPDVLVVVTEVFVMELDTFFVDPEPVLDPKSAKGSPPLPPKSNG